MKISIIMPAYNAGEYIGEAIESILAQTYSDWELVIVDDCSTDSTYGTILSAAKTDSRIKVFRMPVNSGRCLEPRLRAIREASHDYICCIDADDIVEPDYLTKIARRVDETGADIIFTINYAFGGDLGDRVERYASDESFDISRIYTGKELMPLSIGEWEFAAGGGCWNKELYMRCAATYRFDCANAFADEALARAIIFEARKIAFCDASYFYRMNDASVTHSVSVKQFSFINANRWIREFAERNYQDRPDVIDKARISEFHGLFDGLRLLRTLSPSLDRRDTSDIMRQLSLTHSQIDFAGVHGKVSPRLWAIGRLPFRMSAFALGLYDLIRKALINTSGSRK